MIFYIDIISADDITELRYYLLRFQYNLADLRISSFYARNPNFPDGIQRAVYFYLHLHLHRLLLYAHGVYSRDTTTDPYGGGGGTTRDGAFIMSITPPPPPSR